MKKHLVVILMILTGMLCSCGPTWKYNPKWRSDGFKPEFLYDENAIEIHIKSDSRLNWYEEESHTLYICFYQFDNLRAFNQLADQEEGIGLMKLLKCSLFDRSAINAKSFTVYPGKNFTERLDLADETQYLAIVAGYQLLERKRIARVIDIPIFTAEKKSGIIAKDKIAKPGRLFIDLNLGPEQIEEVAEFAQLPGKTEKIEINRRR